jgi:hypothetical protein
VVRLDSWLPAVPRVDQRPNDINVLLGHAPNWIVLDEIFRQTGQVFSDT